MRINNFGRKNLEKTKNKEALDAIDKILEREQRGMSIREITLALAKEGIKKSQKSVGELLLELEDMGNIRRVDEDGKEIPNNKKKNSS